MPTTERFKWARLLRNPIIALVTTLVLVATVIPAFATHPEASLPGSEFEIDEDANLRVDDPSPSIDWANVTEARQEDAATGQNDDSYQGGTKEDTMCPNETTGSIPNNKSDLLTFGVYEEEGDPGYLHLFWSRVNEPSGTTLMDFEFNQSTTPCPQGPNVTRTAGDLLIEYAIDQGGARADITIREWTGSEWGPAQTLSGNDATGTINSSAIPAAESDGLINSGEISPRTFGEASINLDVIFESGKCASFGSAMLKSRASDSFTSQLKDFIAPVPVDIQNCGNVIIRKETDPEEDPNTTTFGYSKTFPTDPATGNTFSLTDDGVKDFDDAVLFGTGYQVTEDVIPSGWDFVSVDCSASQNVTPSINGANVTFDIDSDEDVLDCTYTNRARATLTVTKVTSDGFGSFDFKSSTLTPSPFTLTTTSAGPAGADSEVFSDLAPGTYDVDEMVPTGWNLVSATCDNGDDPASVSLSGGDDVECTFTDARQRGAILITKTRKHAADGAGDHPHPGVTFTVTGGELASGGVEVTTDADGQACLDDLVVSSLVDIDYTVTETVPEGYVADGDTSKTVTVSAESECGDGNEAAVSFSNTPLTDVTVIVDSQVAGGTSSTIDCGLDSAGPGDDVSLTLQDLVPQTITCTIVIDP